MARWLIAITTVVSALLTAPAHAQPLPPPVPAVTDGPIACKPWILLGLRGSGERATERNGLGSAVGFFADEFARQVGQSNISVVGVTNIYSAASVPRFDVRDWRDYFESAQNSAEQLSGHLRAVTGRCPSSRVLVVGYSQGAMVAQMAYDRVLNRANREGGTWRSTADRVYRLVALASPFQNTGSEPVARDDRDDNRRGILASLGVQVTASARTSATKVVGFCADRDLVCDFTSLGRAGIGTASRIHTEFYRRNSTRDADFPRLAALAR